MTLTTCCPSMVIMRPRRPQRLWRQMDKCCFVQGAPLIACQANVGVVRRGSQSCGKQRELRQNRRANYR